MTDKEDDAAFAREFHTYDEVVKELELAIKYRDLAKEYLKQGFWPTAREYHRKFQRIVDDINLKGRCHD